jgi:tRNA threonylcarbamoyladenosine biosynthesis protein TsaE
LVIRPNRCCIYNYYPVANYWANKSFRYICGMEWTFTQDQLADVATACLQAAGDHRVFCFNGQMGAGKTTFIQAFCTALRATDTVSSPTYSLINEYRYPGGLIYHVDLYRLKDADEAARAGVEDCLYSGEYCLVEWPAIAATLMPENALQVHITPVDATTRTLRLELPAPTAG